MSRGTDLAKRAVRRTAEHIEPAKDSSGAWLGKVVSIVSGKVKVKRGASSTGSDEAYARLMGFRMQAENPVVLLPMKGGGHLALGVVDDGTGAYVLERDAEVIGDLTVQGLLTADQAMIGENLSWEMGDEWQNTADPDGSTTDTVNYDTAIDKDVLLDVGNYRVMAVFILAVTHSTSQAVHQRVVIDGQTHTPRSISVNNTVFNTIVVPFSATVAGNRTIIVQGQYKCNNAGTTTAKAPVLLVWAVRVP